MNTYFLLFLRLVLLTSLSANVIAVSDQVLWLPISFSEYDKALKQAAVVVENTERCASVIDGTLKLQKTSREKPIFRIICRDRDKRSYATLVDGETFEEVMLQLSADRRTFEEGKYQSYWGVCEKEVYEKTKILKRLKVVTKKKNPDVIKSGVEGSPDIVRFWVDADAINFQGKVLNYRVTCDFKAIADYKVYVGKRPKTQPVETAPSKAKLVEEKSAEAPAVKIQSDESKPDENKPTE